MPDRAGKGAFRLVKVGVRYCLSHNGIANEGDHVCDFFDPQRDDLPAACNFRELYRKERR